VNTKHERLPLNCNVWWNSNIKMDLTAINCDEGKGPKWFRILSNDGIM